jgi:DNA-binding transcriptional regulator LsrR (DeoR family)
MKNKTTSSQEKQKCEECKKPKEVEIQTEPYTMEELELAMTLLNRFGLSREEVEWLVNLNNRALKDNKRAGCGKCVVQVKKNLTNLYNRKMAGL